MSLDFITSRKNIGASILALAAGALFVLGVTSGWVGLGAIAVFYALGYFLIPPERGLGLTFFDDRDAQQIRQGLNDLTYSLRFRVADDVLAAVEETSRSIQLTMPVEGATGLSAIDPTVMLIRQTALHYLPQALQTYLALPRIYAERVPVQDGKTAKDVLIEQLRLIEQKMRETSQAMYQNDADRLLANARFLEERFARSVFDVVPVVDIDITEPTDFLATTMTDRDPKADGLDIAIGWLQKSIDELSDVTRRVRDVSPGPNTVTQTAPSSSPPDASTTPTAAPTGSTTPLLDRIGRDLTRLAKDGLLGPVVGREEETAWIIETLLRSTKRNPVLLGPPGVGKTAIVEGLAQRIAAGKVPEQLLGTRLVEVPLAAIVAGTQYRGQLEERVQQLVREASQPGIVLFLDEIHLLESAGDTQGGLGAAAVLKPALASGDIAVIGATTGDEYRITIARDDSLARRLSTLEVSELDSTATLAILRSIRDRIATSREVTVSDDALVVLLDFADKSIVNRRLPDKAIDLVEQAVARALVAGRKSVDKDDAVATVEAWAKRASSTPSLEKFGRDLTALARQGKLGPIVGRDREIAAIIEILLRKTKRDPMLLGPAGAGKTAIVEGLAIHLAAGDPTTVPEPLRGVRLFDVALLPLAQAIATDPTLLRDFLAEARHPSVIVFFDEIHLLAAPTVSNLAQALKPSLARGEIACIGATTGEEYQANIEPDAALARRFTHIAVEPMDASAVRIVLRAVRDSLTRSRGVAMGDEVLEEAIALADQFLPNRAFPDKGVDIIEQSIAHALASGTKVVDAAEMRAAVELIVGMPLDPTDRLASLSMELHENGLLQPAEADALTARLAVALRGLDSSFQKPDATVLLYGLAAAAADSLTDVLARTLYGRASAVIDIDLAGMSEDQSISTLLGSAPGLVGSERSLPLHTLRRTPWQVVVLRGIDRCALSIRDTIAQAVERGSFTDSMGRKLPLGAAVVLMTAPAVEARDLLEPVIGKQLLDSCTVAAGAPAAVDGASRGAWLQREVLEPLANRFARQGYVLTFDQDFAAWLTEHAPPSGAALTDFVDGTVAPALAASLPDERGPLTVTIVDDQPALIAGIKR